MLAQTIEKVGQNPTGWLMSEKLDGVRCYWDGNKTYSRTGNEFFPPKWFTDALPKSVALDGELFSGRDDFQKCVGIVKKKDQKHSDDWKKITYFVYDAPHV